MTGRPAPPRLPVGVLFRVGLALARQPALWPIALRQAMLVAGAAWWRRPPHLPVPDRAYLDFRVRTAYGDPPAAPTPDDVVTWLRWCGRMRALGAAR